MTIPCKNATCKETVCYNGAWNVKVTSYAKDSAIKVDSIIALDDKNSVVTEKLEDVKNVDLGIKYISENTISPEYVGTVRHIIKETVLNRFTEVDIDGITIIKHNENILKDSPLRQITLKIDNSPRSIRIGLTCSNNHTYIYNIEIDNA